MGLSAKKLAVGAVRLAAMSQLGPLAGGLFFAGGAVAGRVLAESELAKTIADMGMHLASDAAGELFGSAVEGFRGGHNGDLEKSMQPAVLAALLRLKGQAPDGFDEWFDDWHSFLKFKPAAEVFAGTHDLNPVALSYDNGEFRELWWDRMEPVLVRWAETERSRITSLNLKSSGRLPEPLAAFLKQHLPEALEEAHREVLRDSELERSWIAFQQHVYGETLHRLRTIETKLDDANRKLDILVGRNAEASAAEVKFWNIHLPTNHFHDRPELIERIDDALRHGATALTALHGLGGIGKTQLARRFAQQRRDRYRTGVWLEAETMVSLLTNLSSLAPLLGVQGEQDQQALAVRVMNEISVREPWLVVLDNAESAELVRPYVELLSGQGDVLITSRSEQWDGLATPVSVTKWSVAESARFLVTRTGQSDQAAADGLARDLDGLVLALEHAAAYMVAGDGMALAEYRRVWRARLGWAAKGHAYPDSVAAALSLSLDAVAAKSGAAYDLLCLFAWLAPDRIPRKELMEAGREKLPERLARAFGDHEEWEEATGVLGRYSLLGRERVEGMTTGYYVHRVVQQVVRDRLAAVGSGQEWLAAACDVVSGAFPFDSDEPPFWAVSDVLLPHARVIREHVRLSDSPASLSRLLSQAGLYLKVRGLFAEAKDFFVLALESDLRQFGPDHPTVAIRRSNLANILGNLGDHAEARKQIELALESDLRQFGPDHPAVAVDRSNLANILGALGEYAEARKQIELALESALRQFGPDHPNVATRRSNLAIILRNLGDHAEARKQIELALESDLRQFGPDHPTVAIRRSNLANILGDLGDHAEARKQIELALESDLRQFGPDHPNVATRRNNLAACLYRLGDSEGALREIDSALEICRRTLPEGHPNIRTAEASRKIILATLGRDGNGFAAGQSG